MTLYKYVKFEDLERILNGSIRFTQPGAFNDPFEMVPELLVPKHLANRQVNLQFSVTASRRTPAVHELGDDFESEDCSDINSRRILASLNQGIGVLSLSKNSSSLPMWSHYADRHKGAIIEFDASHEFLEGHFAVEYRQFRPKIDIGSYLDDETPIPIAEICVKPKDWEYENEVRAVRNLSDCKCVGEAGGFPIYTRQLPIDCLKSVILGERMGVDNQRRIFETVKNTHIFLYLDAISNWGYEFRREPICLPGLRNPVISPRTAHIFSHQVDSVGEIARWQIKHNKFSAMMNDTL